jgi:hypothetical protein
MKAVNWQQLQLRCCRHQNGSPSRCDRARSRSIEVAFKHVYQRHNLISVRNQSESVPLDIGRRADPSKH